MSPRLQARELHGRPDLCRGIVYTVNSRNNTRASSLMEDSLLRKTLSSDQERILTLLDMARVLAILTRELQFLQSAQSQRKILSETNIIMGRNLQELISSILSMSILVKFFKSTTQSLPLIRGLRKMQ